MLGNIFELCFAYLVDCSCVRSWDFPQLYRTELRGLLLDDLRDFPVDFKLSLQATLSSVLR